MFSSRHQWLESLRCRLASGLRRQRDQRRFRPFQPQAIEVLEDRTLLSNISIADAVAVETDGGQTGLTFVVTRDANTNLETVTYTTNNGTATTADGDYLANSGTLTFTAGGALTMNIIVLVNGDTKVEANETLTVDIINSSGGAVITDQQATGTITNDDTANLTIANVATTEGNSGTSFLTYQVTLNNAVQGGLNVNYATANGTATAGTDYTAAGGTLTFAGNAGETVAIPVIVHGDSALEANETLTMTLSGVTPLGAGVNAANITPAGSPATGTINNDDSAAISINDVTAAETDSGSTVFAFSVTLNQTVGSAFTVNYTTANGTAIAGTDFFTTAGTLNFTGTQGEVQTIAVLVRGDTTIEADETFAVNLTGATFGVTISDAQGVGTITNDDVAVPATPTLSAPTPTVYDNTPTFMWNSVTGALTYELLVYDLATGQAVITQTGITTNQFTPTTPLKQATHQAFVRAVNNTGASSYSDPLNFSVALLAPTFPTTSAATIDTTPTITWSAATGAATYEVLVYNMVNGQQVIHQTNITATQFTPSSPFSAEDHQVFVRAFDAYGAPSPYSDPQTLHVGSGTPTFSSPDSTTNDPTPKFEWNPVTGAATYELIVYDIATGQAVITETNIATNEFTPTSDLAMADYQAFVRAVDGSNNSGPWSAALNFSIILTAPTVTGPTSQTFDTTPTITWNAVPDAVSYELLVYNSSMGKLVVNQTGITATQFTTSALEQGTHQVFVRAVDGNGTAGLYSDAYYFNVVLGTPTLTSPEVSSGDTTPTFAWTTVNGAAAYELVIYNVSTGRLDGSLSNIFDTQYTQQTPVQPGQYQVFVRAVDAFGAHGSWSAALNFEITDAGEILDPPTITAPTQSTNDLTPTFAWTSVGGAAFYEILVYNIVSGQLVGAQTGIFATQFTFSTPATTGSYQAFVRAVDGGGVGGHWSDALNFEITQSDPAESAERLLEPEFDELPGVDPLVDPGLQFVSIEAQRHEPALGKAEQTVPILPAPTGRRVEVDDERMQATESATIADVEMPAAGIDAVLASWPERDAWENDFVESSTDALVVDDRFASVTEPRTADVGVLAGGAAAAMAGHQLLTGSHRRNESRKSKRRRR